MSSMDTIVLEKLPSFVTDGYVGGVRGFSRQSITVQSIAPRFEELAADGYYFRACNPTFGSGIAAGAQTSFSATVNVLCIIQNSAAANVGTTIYMDYIRLVNTADGLGGNIAQVAVILDTAARYSSGGTALTPVGINTNYANSSVANINFGALTANAASAARQISRATVKVVTGNPPFWVVGDQVMINFGSNTGGDGYLGNNTGANKYAIDVGPVAIAPGNNHSLLIYMWNPSNVTTGPSWEVEIGWWER